MGFIALIINLLIRPSALQFFGFFAASVVFDVLVSLSGYRVFEKKILGSISILAIAVCSAAAAGVIIGPFFMSSTALARWGGVLSWAGLHAAGGVIGGALGVSLINAFNVRGVTAEAEGLKGGKK